MGAVQWPLMMGISTGGQCTYPSCQNLIHGVAYGTADAEFFPDFQLIPTEQFSIFRGKNLGTEDEVIELVYGNKSMPVRLERSVFEDPGSIPTTLTFLNGDAFLPATSVIFEIFPMVSMRRSGYLEPKLWPMAATGKWLTTSVAMSRYLGLKVLYLKTLVSAGSLLLIITTHGQCSVFDGRLFIGTMDWDNLSTPDPTSGFDLFCIFDKDAPAELVDGQGWANWSSYGIRTMEADEDRGELYLGTANVHNLLSEEVSDPVTGGWEIQKVFLSPEE